MKYILILLILVLSACNKDTTDCNCGIVTDTYFRYEFSNGINSTPTAIVKNYCTGNEFNWVISTGTSSASSLGWVVGQERCRDNIW